MDNFLVARPFPGHSEVGAILTMSDFANPHRATQLVDARFLTRMTGTDTSGYQPTAQSLSNATIRQLAAMLADVVDRAVIEAAMTSETRESAIKAMEKRLSEMESGTDEQSN